MEGSANTTASSSVFVNNGVGLEDRDLQDALPSLMWELDVLFERPSLSRLGHYVKRKARDPKTIKTLSAFWNIKEHCRLGIASRSTLFLLKASVFDWTATHNSTIPRCDYLGLRKRQNRRYAAELVRQGIADARNAGHVEAIKKFDSALEMDPLNVEALVARGASLANVTRYEEAMNDFRAALELEPQHQNGRKYLELTKHKMESLTSLNSPSGGSGPSKLLVKPQFAQHGAYRTASGKAYNFEFEPEAKRRKQDGGRKESSKL